MQLWQRLKLEEYWKSIITLKSGGTDYMKRNRGGYYCWQIAQMCVFAAQHKCIELIAFS